MPECAIEDRHGRYRFLWIPKVDDGGPFVPDGRRNLRALTGLGEPIRLEKIRFWPIDLAVLAVRETGETSPVLPVEE